MTWHETIQYIRKKPEYKELVSSAYFDADLPKNVESFGSSEEFLETLSLLRETVPEAQTIVDIGSGNGIAAVNFALNGYNVIAVEPDDSDTVGCGAIQFLKEHYKLHNIQVVMSTAEDLVIPDATADIVYVRQAMHHAHDLKRFLLSCARVLKPGGALLTVRDHVVFNPRDKAWFLKNHPLQRFYGGENAFSPAEYKQAMEGAGLSVVKELRHFDSVINYFPSSKNDIKFHKENLEQQLSQKLRSKLGSLSRLPFLMSLYKFKNRKSFLLEEKNIPGRMYSYLCVKPQVE